MYKYRYAAGEEGIPVRATAGANFGDRGIPTQAVLLDATGPNPRGDKSHVCA